MVESADSAVESVDYTADSSEDPAKIGLWVRALNRAFGVMDLVNVSQVYLYKHDVLTLSYLREKQFR